MNDLNQLAVALFDRHADVYQQKYMDVSPYHPSLDAFCAALPASPASVLELACGPGNISVYLLEKRPDIQLLATDLSENMLTLARQNAPNASFALLDCRQISSLNQTFDGIMCGFAFPYLSREEAETFIADAAAALHAGGVLYISTMEDAYSRSGYQTSSSGDRLYMYFHESAYLEAALHQNGMELLHLYRQPCVSTGDTDLILVARKR